MTMARLKYFQTADERRYARRILWNKVAFVVLGTLFAWLVALHFASPAHAHGLRHRHHIARSIPSGEILCDRFGCRADHIQVRMTITLRHHARREIHARVDANGNSISSAQVCDASHRHCVTVASSAQPILQCVLDHVEAAGVKITALGGIRHGHCSIASMHPCGKALDINQTRRDVNGPPRSVSNSAAIACGAVSGSWWARNPDNGHFQVGGWAGTHDVNASYAYAPRARHHYARRYHRRTADL